MAEGTRPPLGSKPECRNDEGNRRLGSPAGGWRDVGLISAFCSGASSIWGQGCATEKAPTWGVLAGDALPRVTILLPTVRFGAAGGGRSTRKKKIDGERGTCWKRAGILQRAPPLTGTDEQE